MPRCPARTKHSTRVLRTLGVVSTIAMLAACGSDASESTSSVEDAPTPVAVDTTVAPAVSAVESTGVTVADAPATTMAEPGTDATLPGDAVAFSSFDKYTILDDGPGTVVLAGEVEAGVLRPGDTLEILDGGPETATTILRIRVGAPGVEVDSLAAGEFGDVVVEGELGDFEFIQAFVRPTG